MRVVLVVGFVTGCSFQAGSNPGIDATVPAEDALITTDGTLPTEDAPLPPPDVPPALVACTTTDPSLKLCLEFDDSALSSTAIDGSGLEHDAMLANITVGSRSVPSTSQALGVSPSAEVKIPDSTDFDLQRFTITAWVRRTSLPANNQYLGVVDFGRQQASMVIDDAGRIACFTKIGNTTWVKAGAVANPNEWALGVCTFDGPELCAWTSRNGSPTLEGGCGETSMGPVNTGSNTGGTIGGLFEPTGSDVYGQHTGTIDSVRYYSRVLTRAEICSAAGLSGC